ncbi:MAG: carboxypeptidase-like regulatory domain-containing protein [Bacteroidales bacterium]|nr:MAG: carboxypeptidase-like regulatory domain-containing protein [Bacteroidales bacterium]
MISKKLFTLLLFALFAKFSISQATLKGKIFDSETGEPLPFVNVVFNEKGNGFTSGLDGDFKITTNDPVLWLKVSYLGYSPQTITINADNYNKPFKIGLSKTSYQINEVVVKPGVNPAHRIIIAAYNNRGRNNPEKLASYRYTSYNKMYYTFDKLIAKRIKQSDPDTLKRIDSLTTKFDKLKNKHGIMIIETVTQKEFLAPNNNFENVIASKVSGLKDPMISFIATQAQSFTFYKEKIVIIDKTYLNPISAGSTKKYLFILEDTLFTPENDTLFVISYRPHKNRNFEGLMGQLTINSRGYAVQNVIAEPSLSIGLLSVKIQQRYERFNDSTWFPVELNTDLVIIPPDFVDKKTGNTYSMQMLGIGKSYLKDIEINPNLSRKNFSHIETRIDPLAGEHNNAYWNLFRKDSLNALELRTYRILDSIGRKINLDERMRIIESLVTGRAPLGYIDVNLSHILKYNKYEGTRIGIGLETSRKFSEIIKVGGYTAYGLQDEAQKFGGFTELTFSRRDEIKLKYSYMSDVQESGTYSFVDDNAIFFGGDNGRQMAVSKMDGIDEHRVAFSFRFLRYCKLNLSMANQKYNLLSGFYYKDWVTNDTLTSFNQALFTAALRIAPGEKLMETPRSIMPLNFDFPVFWVKYTKGLNALDGGYNFDKLEVRLDKTYKWKILGKSTISIDAGRVFGKIPLSFMYFGRANYLGSLTPDAAHSFAAMRMNEFITDRFVNIFFKHDFGKLLWVTGSKKFQPEFAIVNNISFGDVSANSLHVVPADFNAKVPTKGYFETGIYANKLLSNGYFALGFGTFYRYDSYRFKEFKDNLAYKFTIMVVL